MIPNALDPASASREVVDEILWHDAKRLTIEGRGFDDTYHFYSRLPKRAMETLAEATWWLSEMSAGMAVRFVSDATTLNITWREWHRYPCVDHMGSAASYGVDAYLKVDGKWRWLAVGRAMQEMTNRATLATHLSPEPREYLIFFPLFSVLGDAQIGVNAQASIAPAPPRPANEKPIFVYGTSIVHGSGATRAGMAYPAILGRRLNRASYNFGFSGNALMQAELVPFLNEIDAGIYIIDCLPNMQAPDVEDRCPKFVRMLRASHPDAPIVLVEGVHFQRAFVRPDVASWEAKRNVMLKQVFDALIKEGVTNLHHVPGDLAGDDGDGTTDGIHPSDLGFCRIADALEPLVRRVI